MGNCLTSINTKILDLFQTKWTNNQSALSYKKLTADILKAIILSDVARYTLRGGKVYTLEFQKYEREISILRPGINAYKFYNTVIHDLENEGYFYCIEKGCRSVDEDGKVYSRPSVYCTNENFINQLQLLYKKKKQRNKKVRGFKNPTYVSLNLQKIHDRKRGIEKITVKSYKGTEYTNYRTFIKTIDFSGSVNHELQHDIAENSIIVRTDTYIPLNDCTVPTGIKYLPKIPLNYSRKERVRVGKEMVSWFGSLNYMKCSKRIKNCILIANNIADSMGEDGSLEIYYHDTKNGRQYLFGMNLQMMAKEYRDKVLNRYVAIDMKAAFFSIMYNYITKETNYEGDLTYLKRLYEDPDGYRKHLHEELKQYDPKVEYKYIKTALTSVGYGAHASEKQVSAAINFKRANAIVDTTGYYEAYTPEKLAGLDDFKGIYNEFSAFKKFLRKQIKSSGKTQLTNRANCIIDTTTATTEQLISFIYQGIEVSLLLTMDEYFKQKGKNSVGLLLHDGLYVEKKYVKKNTIKDLEKYIFEKTGYSIKLSLETA